MTNAISGMANAMVNKWPMIVLGGATDANLEGKGAFEEWDQLACARPVTKYAARPASVKHIPVIIEKAVRMSMYGTPGAVYIDLPNDLLQAEVPEETIKYQALVEELPQLVLPQTTVDSTLQLLKSAKTPLIIVGKGIAYADAE